MDIVNLAFKIFVVICEAVGLDYDEVMEKLREGA